MIPGALKEDIEDYLVKELLNERPVKLTVYVLYFNREFEVKTPNLN